MEASAVLACAPSRSSLCCRSCVLAPLRRAFGAVLFAVLSVCCVRCSVLRSARICPNPPFAAIYMLPAVARRPYFVLAEPQIHNILWVVGGTRRACGGTCLLARNARRIWRFIAVGRHRGWVLYISVARSPTVAPYTPHLVCVPPPTLRGAVPPGRSRHLRTPPNLNCFYIRDWGAVKGKMNGATDYSFSLPAPPLTAPQSRMLCKHGLGVPEVWCVLVVITPLRPPKGGNAAHRICGLKIKTSILLEISIPFLLTFFFVFAIIK